MMRGVRPKRFQSGGVNNYMSWTPAQQQAYGNGVPIDQVNAMSPATTIQNGVATTPVVPVDPNSLTPAQVAANILSSSATPPYPTTGGSYSYDPMKPPSQNAAPPAGYTAVPFGTGTGAGGTSVVPTAATYAAMFQQMNQNMTPAQLQNEYAVGNAGLPGALQGNPNITINGQSVPYNSMTPEQQYVYGALMATGQKIPDNFMATYQGPNTAWNSPTLNSIGIPSGQSIVNGSLVNNPSGGAATTSGGQGGIASPGAFTSPSPGAGVSTGGAGSPTTTAPLSSADQPMGTSGGLGYRKGGAMRIRPRRFQTGGANTGAGGGVNPFLQALMQAQPAQGGGGQMPGGMPQAMPAGGGGVSSVTGTPGGGGGTTNAGMMPDPSLARAAMMGQMGGMPGAGGGMNPQMIAQLLQQLGGGGMPGGMPGGGMPQMPGAGSAAQGAMAGALPGGPGAAALGAMAGAQNPGQQPGSLGSRAAGIGALAGASPGTPGAAAMGAMAGAMPGAMPQGMPQSPNQQWGQMMLSGAPNTGLGNAGGISNPQAQQALYRQYMSRLGGGGFGGASGQGAFAEGGQIDDNNRFFGVGGNGRVEGHVDDNNRYFNGQSYRFPLDPTADHTPGSHPDREWGLVAEPLRRARGGSIQRGRGTFDSTKPAPGNLATKAAGKKMANGGTFDSTKGAPGNLPTSASGKKMAEGGEVEEKARGGKSKSGAKNVLRRRPPRAAAPPPPVPDNPNDPDLMAAGAPAAAAAPPAGPPVAPPPGPPPGGAPPFAKGGEAKVCEVCGKAHGGSCKGMRGGGRFHGAKAKMPKMADGGKWISGAIKKPGALHEQLGVPQGEQIPAKKLAKAAKSSGKLGQRARLAQTLKGFKKAAGGAFEAVPIKRGGERPDTAASGPVRRGGERPEAAASAGAIKRGGAKFAAGGAAKQRKGFPNTIKPPKFANGGKIRGVGAAERGTRFSGIY